MTFDLSSRLTLAVPSKGRLKEKTLEILQGAGFELKLPEDERSYFGTLMVPHDGVTVEVELAFLSASEIARELVAGNIHLGVTGEDLAREAVGDADKYLEFPVQLEFGHADVIVAVPQSWYDVDSMGDLDDVAAEFRSRHGRRLRIATKYWQLTQNFFSGHGIAVYRIVESLGATEGAPAAGSADVVVDITSTGSTLHANQLKILNDGIILKSQANIIRSKTANWNDETFRLAQSLCDCVDASLAASK